MLQITPIMVGKTAAKWEYYAQEYAGTWEGKGAELLGLTGEVRREDFNALSNNRMPGTGEKLTVRVKTKRRAGYDMCFDVPKSLSIYMAETGDKQMQRLIQEAANETMRDIETEMGTRVRKDGADDNRTTGNMLYASFVHTTTRPVNGVTDPHYHVHYYCVNATRDFVEDRWKAGEFGCIKKRAAQYQSDYHERLLSKLKANGYRVRKTEQAFEMESVSRELIDKFSRRRAIIKKALKERYEGIERRARNLANKMQIRYARAVEKIKARFGTETRERKSRKKPNPIEQLLSWRKQMTSEERYSVRQAMPITPDRAPNNIRSILGQSKRVEREQGRER